MLFKVIKAYKSCIQKIPYSLVPVFVEFGSYVSQTDNMPPLVRLTRKGWPICHVTPSAELVASVEK